MQLNGNVNSLISLNVRPLTCDCLQKSVLFRPILLVCPKQERAMRLCYYLTGARLHAGSLHFYNAPIVVLILFN